MMLHGAQSPSVSPGHPATTATATTTATAEAFGQNRRMRRKRKAESQDNERLSKRLSLLNIEQNGPKLYVPVEAPSVDANANPQVAAASVQNDVTIPDDTMQVDNSKHKVYIYNIDDELSSDSESDDGRLVFLPNIEKHLRENRIPPSVLANSDGELAGMQVVLYSDPKSLTVPEEKDSVRKAIIESRHRVREQQRLEREGKTTPVATNHASTDGRVTGEVDMAPEYDSDAMDID
ncbi:Fc.00g016760.m01.CDS01 [Cosmosporella sp. VM-42]